MTRKWIYVAVAAATLLILGCNKGSWTTNTTGGTPTEVSMYPELIASRPYVPDVPVPLDFKQVEKRSIDFGSGSARYVRHVYKGKDDKWDVRRFYEKQMPINRWSQVTYINEDGEISLDYEKGNERCRVMISDGDWFYPVRVTVRLWTSGPIVAKRTRKTS